MFSEERLVLRTIDGVELNVLTKRCFHSDILLKYCNYDEKSREILPRDVPIHSSTLSKILQWMESRSFEYKNIEELSLEDLHEIDLKFLQMDDEQLLEVSKAAYQLSMPQLVEICAISLARRLEKMSVAEIRKLFKVVEDLDSKEQAKIHNKTERMLSVS